MQNHAHTLDYIWDLMGELQEEGGMLCMVLVVPPWKELASSVYRNV